MRDQLEKLLVELILPTEFSIIQQGNFVRRCVAMGFGEETVLALQDVSEHGLFTGLSATSYLT